MTVGEIYRHLAPMERRLFAVIAAIDTSLPETISLLTRILEHTERVTYGAHAEVIFTDSSFGRLIQMCEPIYSVLCYEFFATVTMDRNSMDFSADGFISFRIGGVFRNCSLLEFA